MGSSRLKDGPVIGWPQSFEMTLSNNDPGLNITEVIYMVSYSQKIDNLNKNAFIGWKQTENENTVILLNTWIRLDKGI